MNRRRARFLQRSIKVSPKLSKYEPPPTRSPSKGGGRLFAGPLNQRQFAKGAEEWTPRS